MSAMNCIIVAFTILALNTANARMIYPDHAPMRIVKRQVPQEHSHDRITDFMREKCFKLSAGNLPDPIFGLLGKAYVPTIDRSD
jgi:hypothetical protein